MNPASMVSRGEIVELVVESAAHQGTSVGRIDRLVVFVPLGVPGDRVRVRIVKKRRKFVEGQIEEILTPSPDRIQPRCRHFGVCGGCQLQNMSYTRQLEIKTEQVETLMKKFGGLEDVRVEPALGASDQYYYRNKMEFSFGTKRWLTQDEIASGEPVPRDFGLGLHIPKRFDRILDLHECFLQDRLTSQLLNRLRHLAQANGWEPYDSRNNTGYARNLVIRTAQSSREIMMVFMSTRYDEQRIETLVNLIRKEFPAVTTLINSVNPGRGPVADARDQHLCFGNGFIRECLGGLSFQITPTCFFQPNTRQAERLLQVIKDCAQASRSSLLYDLYCGVGTIGLFLSGSVRAVVGVENHPESIRLAQINASVNGIENCHFQRADAVEGLKSNFFRSWGRPDVVILDPPRAGLHPKVCKGLLAAKPDRIVYTSCNPATQARDIKLLTDAYRVDRVQPVDMFPQTYHIETVAVLRLKG